MDKIKELALELSNIASKISGELNSQDEVLKVKTKVGARKELQTVKKKAQDLRIALEEQWKKQQK